jgi:hypothetical protein
MDFAPEYSNYKKRATIVIISNLNAIELSQGRK